MIDREQSHIEIEVNATAGSFVGHLADYQAEIFLEPETTMVQRAEVSFQFLDVKTGEDKRDRHMHDWQETDKFPDGRFELGEIEEQADGSFKAKGKLSLHGVWQEITFPVTILTAGSVVSIDGEAALNVTDFGLPVIRKFLILTVDPVVTVRFHLQGSSAPSA